MTQMRASDNDNATLHQRRCDASYKHEHVVHQRNGETRPFSTGVLHFQNFVSGAQW